MKTFKVIVLVGFACSIVGCSKSSDSGAPKIPEVPVSLDFAKPQVGEKLTRNQVAKIRDTKRRKSGSNSGPDSDESSHAILGVGSGR